MVMFIGNSGIERCMGMLLFSPSACDANGGGGSNGVYGRNYDD